MKLTKEGADRLQASYSDIHATIAWKNMQSRRWKERAVVTRGQLRVGPHTYRLAEAREVILGYAFGEDVISQFRRIRPRFDLPSTDSVAVRRWGYATYDCIPSAAGSTFEPVDLLVAGGLNGRVSVSAMASMLAATD